MGSDRFEDRPGAQSEDPQERNDAWDGFIRDEIAAGRTVIIDVPEEHRTREETMLQREMTLDVRPLTGRCLRLAVSVFCIWGDGRQDPDVPYDEQEFGWLPDPERNVPAHPKDTTDVLACVEMERVDGTTTWSHLGTSDGEDVGLWGLAEALIEAIAGRTVGGIN